MSEKLFSGGDLCVLENPRSACPGLRTLSWQKACLSPDYVGAFASRAGRELLSLHRGECTHFYYSESELSRRIISSTASLVTQRYLIIQTHSLSRLRFELPLMTCGKLARNPCMYTFSSF